MKKHSRGFTLIELLVVIVIISVLAMVGLASYRSVNQRSRDARRAADMEQVRAALEMYRSDQTPSVYPLCGIAPTYTPTTACFSGVLLSALTSGTPAYINPFPVDPRNSSSYVYKYGSNGDTYTLQYYSEVGGATETVSNPL